MLGWLLSTLTILLKEFRDEKKRQRKLFTQLDLSISKFRFSLEFERIYRDVGGLETLKGMVDLDDEFWIKRLPYPTPTLPENFERILEQFSEWEFERGRTTITEKLISFKILVEGLRAYYAIMELCAKEGEEIPKRLLGVYQSSLPNLKKEANDIHKLVSSLRFSWKQRPIGRIKTAFSRRKS